MARRINILHMLNRYCIIKSDFDVYPNHDKQSGVYTAVGTGHMDGLATSLILTRISQLLHLVLRMPIKQMTSGEHVYRVGAAY